ncbi:MAG: hypothetical protein JW969_01580 [Spirochaetales bacterium]|nr:hypothetical protein [Spirochaetales bacterium]
MISLLRNLEKEVFEYLEGLAFTRWRHDSGRALSRSLTRWRDKVVLKIMDFTGGLGRKTAVTAAGSYGRRELSPYSEMNFMVLTGDKHPPKDQLDTFFNLLAEIGYKVNYAVSTAEVAAENFLPGLIDFDDLLDMRFLAGDKSLFDSSRFLLSNQLPQTRVACLNLILKDIYAVIDNAAGGMLSRDPDLVNNPGGLQSLNSMQRLNTLFGDFQDAGNREKEKGLYAAFDFILQVRNVLHFISGGNENILTLEHQKSVADRLHIKGGCKEPRRVLMQRVYRFFHKIFFSYFILADRLSFIHSDKHGLSGYSEGYYVIKGKMYIHAKCAVDYARALQFVHICTEKRYLLTSSLLVYLKNSSRRMRAEDIMSADNINRVIRILSLGNSCYALTLMKLSGLLYRAFPLLQKVKYLPEFKTFHKYTVDQHSLEAVKAIEQLKDGEQDLMESRSLTMMRILYEKYSSQIWILKLGLLLHDAGKAYSLDHIKNGISLIKDHFSGYPISDFNKDLVLFLVNRHLLLSHIIYRADLNDHEVISDLSHAVIVTPFPADYLDFLYLLTYADIMAKDPGYFTGYISETLDHLYTNMQPLIHGGSGKERFEEENLLKLNELSSAAREFAQKLGEKYVFTTSTADIEEDYLIFEKLKENPANVKYKVRHYNETLKIKFYSNDKAGLFGFLCGVLLINGADIIRAAAHTIESVAVDEFYIACIFGQDPLYFKEKNELYEWEKKLEKYLAQYWNDKEQLELRIGQCRTNILKADPVFKRDAAVHVKQKSERESLLEISCTDRPALLYDITLFFAEESFLIQGARVETCGWEVHDYFEIKHNPMTEKEMKNKIDRLVKICDYDID